MIAMFVVGSRGGLEFQGYFILPRGGFEQGYQTPLHSARGGLEQGYQTPLHSARGSLEEGYQARLHSAKFSI